MDPDTALPGRRQVMVRTVAARSAELCAIGVSDQFGDARGGVGLHAWQNVGVLVHRELRGVVPEPF